MSAWMLAAVVLLMAMVPCLGVCVLAAETDALAAVEVASTLLASVLMLLSEGLHRQPFVDLALTFALISIVGVLAFARTMEHDV